MVRKNHFEIVIGLIVVTICSLFAHKVYTVRAISKSLSGSFYLLKGRFSSVEGVNIDSDVKIGGINVGRVISKELDSKQYRILMVVSISSDVKIPRDSVLSISSSGLLGGKFVEIKPGGSDDMFSDGDIFDYTQSSLSIEDLIGKFAFSNATK